MRYTVQEIRTGEIVYRGPGEAAAAAALVAGTCYGRGVDARCADAVCQAWREFFLSTMNYKQGGDDA